MSSDVARDPLGVGGVVRRLREERGLTQERLAFEANVTMATLSRIERGVTGPALATVAKIAAALEMQLPELASLVVGKQVDDDEVRRDLEAYAQTHADRDAESIAELVGIVYRARAAGLDADAIALLACGGRAA